MAEKKEEKPKSRYEVGQQPTEHRLVIIDNETDEVMDLHLALGKILNQLDLLSKTLVGK